MDEDDFPELKTPGDYALMWANGMSWDELVAKIREEALREPNRCYPCDDLRFERGCFCA